MQSQLKKASRARRQLFSLTAWLLAVLFLAAPGRAQNFKDSSPYSDAALLSENTSIRAGKPFTVALRLRMEPHWHSYWRNAGDSGLPTTIQWKLPPGFRAGTIQWPYPQRVETPPLVTYAFENEVWLLTQITPPKSLPKGKPVALRASAKWLVCKELCVPARDDVSVSLPVSLDAPAADARWSAGFAKVRAALPVAPQGWVLRAGRAKGKGFALFVQPPRGREKAVAGAHFFASEASVIAHAEKQKITRTGEGFRIALAASEYAATPPARLRGVLVAPQGQAWNESGARALNIDVPLEASASFTPRATAVAAPVAPSGGAAPTLVVSLGLAFLGGLLLNLMPCVFPVLSLKILSFVQQSGDDKTRIKKHGLAFGAGVLGSFWILAGALLLVRASGGGAGWGFQLQSPVFVAALAMLLFGVGLNLLGAFEVGLSLTGLGSKTALAGSSSSSGHAGYGGSFWSGVLATVVATPCTAPFMGAALGFALSQPPIPALSVFTALGLGMAAPYVLLSLNPSWLKKLPRPGAWMETFKQAMAFPIFATVLWLLWVFGLQTGVDGVGLLGGALLLLGAAVWLWGRWDAARLTPARRVLARGGALLSLFGALLAAWNGAKVEAPTDNATASASAQAEWQPFSIRKVAQLQAQGRPVFIDFTAAWCITCQVNKRATLARPGVKSAFAQRNVALLRADWTRRDAEITRALESYGRSGVPTYVLLPAKGGKPQVLPEVLSETLLTDALATLSQSSTSSTRRANALQDRG